MLLVALPASAKETVKLAFIGPLTGGNSAIGLGGRNSADLAVKLRNADPKAKYQYELVVLDDECKPDTGVQVATKAGADRSIVAGVTHYCSVVAVATVETFHRLGLPTIVWGAVLPDITYGHSYKEIHRVNGTMINQNETAAKLMLKQGFRRWVIIHDTTDYGKGHEKYFTQFATAGGGKILGSFGVTADQQDFTAELTQAKALNPEVIFFGGLTPIGVRIRAQMDKLGINAQFQGTSGIVNDDFIKALGPLAEGVVAFREGAPAGEAARREVLPREVRRAEVPQPARGLRPLRLRRGHAPDGHHRQGRPGPEEDPHRPGRGEERGLHRRPHHLRRPRPEHGRRHHRATSSRTGSGSSGRTASTPAGSAS